MGSTTEPTGIDAASQAWIESLRGHGPIRDQALARLHALLVRAARFEIARRRRSIDGLDAGALEDLATQSADDALVALLSKLDQFQGRSQFTTWAYKFALVEAAVKLRRRPWQDREIGLDPDGWQRLAGGTASPVADVEQRELVEAVVSAIQTELTPHQREILLAVAVTGVPIDVLAERMQSTRGALYKTIHDARRKLRRRLHADGYEVDPPVERGPRD